MSTKQYENFEVWNDLSSINVNDQIEKKGRFKYLSWAWAWEKVKEYACDASYEIHEDIVYPDQTREVRCTVTIDNHSHMMWLPVMNNQNQAIKNPDARAISDARMRCLVKAIAMHGLGHYIYAGEDVPRAKGEAEDEGEPLRGYPEPQEETSTPQINMDDQQRVDAWLEFYKTNSDPQKFADVEHKFNKFMNRVEDQLSAHLTSQLWEAHDTAKKGLMA